MLKPIIAGLAAFIASAAGMAIAQDGPPPGGPQGGPMRGGLMRADTNGDGVITRDEYMAWAMQRFDRLDRNHDGKIDQTEMQEMGGGRGGGRRGQGGGMGGDMPPPPPPGMSPQ